ncbi:methyltransferase family protein [Pelagibacterium montanilacus]|uniref:methyltransferase family protein n=1 Tax=Pelagibacterium montanilacus TaxID=2185280 RepID=UPI0013DEDDB8|nr:isoprenylcysteine carboxylmethyltransferase family protein [Pelagibacterium montanilacus]
MSTSRSGDTPGIAVLPPIYPAVALIAAIALERVLPLAFLPVPHIASWPSWLGVVMVLTGLAFALSAVSAFNDAGTPPEPHKMSVALVTAPPFTMTRNPIYLGFILMVAGISLAFALEWGLISIPLLWLALDRFVVAREEVYLRGRFGEAYEAYCKSTRRWL